MTKTMKAVIKPEQAPGMVLPRCLSRRSARRMP